MSKVTKQPAKETAVLVVTEETKAPQMLILLKQELNKLVQKSTTKFKTTGNLQLQGGNLDIKTETKIENLIKAMAAVEVQENAYNQAAEGRLKPSLNNQFPPFSVSGGTADDWAHDINLRIEVIAYAERKKELEELVKEGEAFLTKEDQYAMYVNKLKSKFGKAEVPSIEEV